MLIQLIIGGILITVTVVFHAFALDFIIRKTHWLESSSLRQLKTLWKALILAIVVLSVTCALIAEIWVWALFFLLIGSLPDLETALYFSTSTFTTLGFGDILLDRDWRLLGSIEGANGFLLFGWSTAFIFEIVTRVYRKEGRAIQN
jgi:hypothetical protein